MSPYDTVVAVRNSDHLFIYKGEGDRDLRLIYDHTLELPGWDGNGLDVDGNYFEHLVEPFSADFSQVVFAGQPYGAAAKHIGRLDLLTGDVVDMTAARQGTGFSDPVLCEDAPGYVFQTSPAAGSGSDTLVFRARSGALGGNAWCFGDRFLSSVSNPRQVAQIDEQPSYWWTRKDASEDGRYLFGYDEATGVDGFHAADGSQHVEVDCVPDGDYGENELLLGWVGPRTVALEVSEVDWRTATILPDGRVECAGGIPATDKEISDVELSFDSKAILFSAEGTSGTEQYRQPVTGGEPVQASYEPLPEDTIGRDVAIYRVGPMDEGWSENATP